jgi:hypothetical protein
VKLRSDCGTENGIMADMQCEFRSSGDAHFFETSPANQRIESWWFQLKKNRSTWWINYFKDLCERNLFNPDNDLEKEYMWFSGTHIESEIQSTTQFLACAQTI